MACGCSGSSSSSALSDRVADRTSDSLADNVTLDLGAALIGAAVGAGASYLVEKDVNLWYVGAGALINGIFLKLTFSSGE